MKRTFCLFLIGIVLISLTACSSNNGQENNIANSSNLNQLTDFKCYAAYQDATITIDGIPAKDLYNLISGAAKEQEHNPASSNKNYIYLVFYNSEAEFPLEEINTNSFWGAYTIYDDGSLVFSKSPYHSAASDYQLDSNIYYSVIDIILDNN